MTGSVEGERTYEISTLLDAARAISPNSKEIASGSRASSDPTSTEELAVTKLLDDNGKSSKDVLEILSGTQTGESIKKYLGLEEGENNLLVERRKHLSSSSRRVMILANPDSTYRMVRFDKEHNKPFEVDVLNAEEGDENITLDEGRKEKLDEHIDSQRVDYEYNLNELVKRAY